MSDSRIPSDLLVGSVHNTTYCGKIEIIKYEGRSDITVKFLNTGTILNKIVGQRIRVGHVSDPFHPFIAKRGYKGIGPYSPKQDLKAYARWWGIFFRLYLSSNPNNIASYKNCSIDERWYNFQNFTRWFYSQSRHTDETYDIDKDLKIPGNLVYGPDTCLLIPESLNVIMSSDKPNPLAHGVSKRHNKYIARVTIDGIRFNIGSYDTVEEATQAYRIKRNEAVINRATKLFYENKITKDILDLVLARYSS